jgi:uncharacterized protein (UPF0335 family)
MTHTQATSQENTQGVDSMPSSLTQIEPIVREFVEKLKSLKNEQELLKQDEKDLIEEYSSKLDMKTLKAAMRVVAVKEKVDRKETFDTLVEVLERIGE